MPLSSSSCGARRWMRVLPHIQQARSAGVDSNALSGPAAPCEVISTSLMLPSGLNVMGSMHTVRIERVALVVRWYNTYHWPLNSQIEPWLFHDSGSHPALSTITPPYLNGPSGEREVA